ncbi:hypothetical protein BCR33DRAFT_764198 [Rhizoclosmatium globosum]|uniref:Trafficking protein particle complex subunit 11 domain-containing protein n=1 Tax=Rhizoclosmatium globosum TaxID=329046 RepID=A0A1Y2CLK1_9FUNG|nr:hypothetical protein BCR33DRAFT_764198 [Rhizoclosmatium globosum]|eukprot:ORY47827.1 hypothetical protein BCR33DRAFT_764198 [Rhizoclosmatium globosum]
MDTYPLEFTLHNTPLLAVTGLVEAREADGTSVEALIEAALLSRNASSLWESSASRGFFHVVSLPKNHVFPTRSKPSPLSPHTPNSPLHPDGLVTPAWIARHRSQAPCVLVAVARFASTSTSTSTSNAAKDDDALIIDKIKSLRKVAADRSAKLAVALILDAQPNEREHRIQALRRACALDSKNALFVFPPNADIGEFVNGLQRHLYEHAVAYYREHGRRIKKKKAKVGSGPLGVSSRLPPPPAAVNLMDADIAPPTPQPLSPLGWSVRYDYKLAVFAEFRQDLETAIKHYEDCYSGLMDLFWSTLGLGSFVGGNGAELLTPFSKRWVEAKVLADCVSIKICKLYLYADTPLPALQQHQKHLNNFKCLPEFAGDLSTGTAPSLTVPGLRNYAAAVPGNGSFEYWAWVSKQCRVFGELIEIATKIGLRLPFPPPLSAPPLPTSTTQSIDPTPLTQGSTTPSAVIQHAGYYYYMSASAAEERWTRFKLIDERFRKVPPLDTTSPRAQSELHCLATERSLDHTAHTIELLTKSYEQFKRAKSGRMTLFLAAEIARVYESAGKSEMALKFFERIGKTYRKENWPSVLAVILGLSVGCARKIGRVGAVVEGLVELLRTSCCGLARAYECFERCSWFYSVEKSVTVIDVDKVNGFMGCSVQFFKPNAYVRQGVRFQVTLFPQGGEDGWPVEFTASKVRVLFSNGRLDNLWVHDDSATSTRTGKVSYVDCSSTVREVDPDSKSGDTPTTVKKLSKAKGDLLMVPGIKKVIEGQVIPTESEDLKIVGVMVYIEQDVGVVCMHYKIGERHEDSGVRRKWYSVSEPKPRFTMLEGHGELSTIRVIQRQPRLILSLVDHAAPVLLDETYAVTLELSNEEPEDLEGTVEIDFKSSVSMESFDRTSQIAKEKAALPPLHGAITPLSATSAASSSHQLDLLESPFLQGSKPAIVQHEAHPDHALTNLDFGLLKRTPKHVSPSSSVPSKPPTRATFTSPSTLKYQDDAGDSELLESQYRFRKVETFKISYGESGSGAEAGLLMQLLKNPGSEVMQECGWTLTGTVKAQAPCELIIREAQFVPANVFREGVVKVDVKGVDLKKEDVEVKLGDSRNYIFHMVVTLDLLRPLSESVIGSLAVDWKRMSGCDEDWTRSLLKLPAFDYTFPDVWTLLELPGETRVGTPFSLTYHVQNASLSVLNLNMLVEPSDAFVFGGCKALQNISLLPMSERILRFVVIPLAAGNNRLPRVKVTRQVVDVSHEGEVVDEKSGLVDEVIPLFVLGGGLTDEAMIFVSPPEL